MTMCLTDKVPAPTQTMENLSQGNFGMTLTKMTNQIRRLHAAEQPITCYWSAPYSGHYDTPEE